MDLYNARLGHWLMDKRTSAGVLCFFSAGWNDETWASKESIGRTRNKEKDTVEGEGGAGKCNKTVVKGIYLSSNEAEEDRVNIHHPGSYQSESSC